MTALETNFEQIPLREYAERAPLLRLRPDTPPPRGVRGGAGPILHIGPAKAAQQPGVGHPPPRTVRA